MTRVRSGSQSGGARELILVTVAVAGIALVGAMTRDAGSNKSTAVTTTTMSDQRLCDAKVAAYNSTLKHLENRRSALLNRKGELENSKGAVIPLGGTGGADYAGYLRTLDAQDVVVVRGLEDVQTRMIRLFKSRSPRQRSCP